MGCFYSKNPTVPLVRQMSKPPKTSYKYIAYSGGSTSGILLIGAYQALYKNGLIATCQGAVGTSIGSFFALISVLGADPNDLAEQILTLDISRLADYSYNIFKDITNIETRYGLCNGLYLECWVDRYIEKIINKAKITFKELHSITQKHLKICVFNESKQCCEYWSHENMPDVPVSHAIRISTSMPLFYETVTFQNNLYVDGGVGDIFPLAQFPVDETLGILISNDLTTKGFKSLKIRSFIDHVIALYVCVTNQLMLKNMPPNWEKNTIILNSEVGHSQWDFNFTQEEKVLNIKKGYDETIADLEDLLRK